MDADSLPSFHPDIVKTNYLETFSDLFMSGKRQKLLILRF